MLHLDHGIASLNMSNELSDCKTIYGNEDLFVDSALQSDLVDTINVMRMKKAICYQDSIDEGKVLSPAWMYFFI